MFFISRLYHFGGTYADTDVIFRKNINNLSSNYVGAETSIGKESTIASSVLNFQHEGIGKTIATNCLMYVYEM